MIDDIDKLWNFWSTKLAMLGGILATIGAAWGTPAIPEDVMSALPSWFGLVVRGCTVLVVLGIIPARAIKQQRPTPPADGPTEGDPKL